MNPKASPYDRKKKNMNITCRAIQNRLRQGDREKQFKVRIGRVDKIK